MQSASKIKRLFAIILVFAGMPGWKFAQAEQADQVRSDWYPIPSGSQFLTGDSWSFNTVTYRLYGGQSCIRGTTCRNSNDKTRDCGEASLGILVSLIRDLKPLCRTAAEDVPLRTRHVFCMAVMREGTAAGTRIDLGTALITQGFGFAARRADGSIVHPAYGVAEDQARRQKAGLWAFPDLPNPTAIIAQTMQGRAPAPTQPAH